MPWLPGTAMCLADLEWTDGSPVVASPRQILRRQADRLAERGWTGLAGTELEFIVFRDTYEEAWHKAYRGLDAGQPLQRRLLDARDVSHRAAVAPDPQRDGRRRAAARVGQGRVQPRASTRSPSATRTLLTTADGHAIYKTGAKEIAAQEGMSLTFMAKFDEREGNSCHIHLSLRDARGRAGLLAGDDGSPDGVFASFLAGMLATLPELTLLLAPNINSYKRYAEGSFAPTAVAWGLDNRTCSLRVVGHGPSLGSRTGCPGAT